MCGGSKDTKVQAVEADGSTNNASKSPGMTPKDIEQMKKFESELEANKSKFSAGPISKRNCTDCCCCFLFIFAIIGFAAASAYGWFNGDPRKLLIGWDTDGRGCGFTPEVENYPYLYWATPPSGDAIQEAVKTMNLEKALDLLNTGVCVSECPTADSKTLVDCMQTAAMQGSTDFAGCTFQIGLEYLTKWLPPGIVDKYINKFYSGTSAQFNALQVKPKLPFRYETFNAYGFCVPKIEAESAGAFSEETVETFKKLFQDTIMNDAITQYIADIAYCWRVIAICSLTAVFLGYLYLFIVRCIGAIIVWLSIILIQVSLIAAGAYVYMQADTYEPDNEYHDYVKYAAYTLWGVAGLYMCCVCCCWNAIRIGIAVYQTTAQYISSNLRIFLLPFVTYIFAFLWLAVWLVSFIFVFSIGEPVQREAPYQFLTEMKWDDKTRYIVVYQLFMLFWLNAFIMGMCQFIIAASACIWYFEVNSDTGGKGTVGRGIWWGFRYHMGSIAFGAALIAICQLIRVIFEYYRRKIQAMTKNAVVRCLLCYTAYLLWLLEKCVKFITRNAYIQVALSNTFFCKAALNAFALILRNVHRFGWVGSIGFVLNWFGVCSVAGANGFGAYIAITQMEEFKGKVTQPLAPAIVILLMSVLIVKSFLSIFTFSLDAILQAFLLDESLGFSGQARPNQMAKFKTTLEKNAK